MYFLQEKMLILRRLLRQSLQRPVVKIERPWRIFPIQENLRFLAHQKPRFWRISLHYVLGRPSKLPPKETSSLMKKWRDAMSGQGRESSRHTSQEMNYKSYRKISMKNVNSVHILCSLFFFWTFANILHALIQATDNFMVLHIFLIRCKQEGSDGDVWLTWTVKWSWIDREGMWLC